MDDASRRLRYHLGTLCERYSAMVADKDTLDYRLGSPEPYAVTINDTNAEGAYEDESRTVSNDLRTLIVEIIDTGRQIREIEHF